MPQTHRFIALDSLRGVCACMVALFHFNTCGAISRSELVQHSGLFVDFFFVLSGFVITAGYGQKLSQGFSIFKFIGLRLGRIYPLHLTMLLLFLAFELLYASGNIGRAPRPPFHSPNDLPSFLASLALIQTFLPMNSEGWNSPSWSIQVEIWTYFLYAGLFRWMLRVLVPVALLLAFVNALIVYHATGHCLTAIHEGAWARCIYGFSLGVICYRLYCADDIVLSRPVAGALEVAAVTGTVGLVIISGTFPLSMIVPLFFSLVVLIFAKQQGLLSTLLVARVPRLLGTLSFSIYLIHMFLFDRLFNVATVIDNHTAHRFKLVIYSGGDRLLGASPLLADVLTIAALVLVVGSAFITYHLIERPTQLWSRRLILGEHPRHAVVRAETEAPSL